MKKISFLFLLFLVHVTVFSQTDSSGSLKSTSHIFKFNFFSPLSGHAMLSYEKGIRARRSQEFSISIIGAGKNINSYYSNQTGDLVYDRKQFGVSLGYGLRYYMPRNVSRRKNVQVPDLTGFYFKPTVYGNFFVDNPDLLDGRVLNNDIVLSGAILMETGWQAIVGKIFTVDAYGGFGYSAINIDYKSFSSQSNYNSAFGSNKNWRQYTYIRFGRTVGLALSGGFRVGVISRKKNSSK
jgi:hypothetical protein